MVYSTWSMSQRPRPSRPPLPPIPARPEPLIEETTDISPLALSILELLDQRPMHPYELASTMRDHHQDEFIRLNFGSLYHTVEVLERNGWIFPAEREKEG